MFIVAKLIKEFYKEFFNIQEREEREEGVKKDFCSLVIRKKKYIYIYQKKIYYQDNIFLIVWRTQSNFSFCI